MAKDNLLNAVEQLNSALNKVHDFDVSSFDLSERVKENRIITLDGYLKFLNNVGIPEIKEIYETLKEVNHDRSDIL